MRKRLQGTYFFTQNKQSRSSQLWLLEMFKKQSQLNFQMTLNNDKFRNNIRHTHISCTTDNWAQETDFQSVFYQHK